MSERTPTPQQEAVYEAISSGRSHVVVSAVAGAGKTTTAIGAAKRSAGTVRFVAYNKHIAEELKGRLAGGASASTMNSLGHAAVCRALGSPRVDVNKPKNLLSRVRPAWVQPTRRGGVRVTEQGLAAIELLSHCKLTLTPEGNREALASLADYYGVDLPSDPSEVFAAVPELVALSASETRTIDFNDQLWLPIRLNLPMRRFDLLLVDEAQDLSRCAQALALRAAEGGRLVPIGDPRQAINGFAGADPEAFDRLSKSLIDSPRGGTLRPLTVTFRCPVSHVCLAQRIVPEIQPAPGAPDGILRTIPPDRLPSEVRQGDMVIARRNSPLITLAFRLIRDGLSVLVRGREIGVGLLDLIDRLGAPDIPRLIEELHLYEARQLERLERKRAGDAEFQGLADRVNCLHELATAAASVGELRSQVESLFSNDDPAGRVVLSSIHRAKGLEADRVFITDTKCLPLIFSCSDCRGKGCDRCGGRGTRSRQWEVCQEYNLIYVALTRARKELVFAGAMPPFLGGAW